MTSCNRFTLHFALAAVVMATLAFTTVANAQWTPADLTNGSELWLDAADFATFTLSGMEVQQWNDKSGNNNHVSAANAGVRPTYLPTGFTAGTMPSVQFTSPPNVGNSGDALRVQLNLPASDWSAFVVVDDQSNDNENWAIVGTSSAGNPAGWHEHRFILGQGGPQVAGGGSPLGGTDNAATFIAGEQILNWVRATGTDSEVLRNGEQISANSNTYSPVDWNEFRLGARSTTTGHAGMNGELAEIILLSENPTEIERQTVEGYLAWKWGLVDSLPDDHPFKNDGSLFGFGAAVPEPASIAIWTLIGLGLVGFGYHRARRNK